MIMKIKIPCEVKKIITVLENSGFEAYVVGGCVRDSLLGLTPQDWDVASSATPEETKACFAASRIIETGLKHGTLTILTDGFPVEVTTFRIDGEYGDCRRPDSVTFTRDLTFDLSRRDFTINAMAYHPEKGIIDCFGGLNDLTARRIVCVGEPEKRFSEDALRILRAVRFAATMGFDIESKTQAAMVKLSGLLNKISAERITAELNKTLLGKNCADILLENSEIFVQILPELRPMFGFEQHSKYHSFDVWRHTVEAVKVAPYDLFMRLTMLLHDIGKPQTFSTGGDGEGHFYGHANVSAGIANQILSRLKYNNATKNSVVELIKHHCDDISAEPCRLQRALNKMGEENLRWLIEVKRADCRAKGAKSAGRREDSLDAVLLELNKIIDENRAFKLSGLAINGNDLIALGFKEGAELGGELQRLLSLVMDDAVQNEREALLAEAARSLKK